MIERDYCLGDDRIDSQISLAGLSTNLSGRVAAWLPVCADQHPSYQRRSDATSYGAFFQARCAVFYGQY